MPADPTIPDANCPPFSSASARDLLAGILLANGGDPANIPNTTQCREWGYGKYTERDILAAILLATGNGGGSALNPGVAYIQTNGTDSTAELGNPAKPFLTVAAALAAATTAGQSLPTLVFGRGTFVADALLTSNASVIFLTGAGSAQTILNASWVGDAGTAGPNGDPPSSGGDGESFTGCPTLQSNQSLALNISITGGTGGAGGDNTGETGIGASGASGGDIAGITLNGVIGSVSMVPGSGGAGGDGPEGGGDPGADGTASLSSFLFCNLTLAGAADFDVPCLAVIDGSVVSQN